MISFRKPRITRRSQHGVVFCSQILFLSATVAFRTNFLSLADFKSDLSRTNLKLPSSATWPLVNRNKGAQENGTRFFWEESWSSYSLYFSSSAILFQFIHLAVTRLK